MNDTASSLSSGAMPINFTSPSEASRKRCGRPIYITRNDIPLILRALLGRTDKWSFHVDADKIRLFLTVQDLLLILCCHSRGSAPVPLTGSVIVAGAIAVTPTEASYSRDPCQVASLAAVAEVMLPCIRGNAGQ